MTDRDTQVRERRRVADVLRRFKYDDGIVTPELLRLAADLIYPADPRAAAAVRLAEAVADEGDELADDMTEGEVRAWITRAQARLRERREALAAWRTLAKPEPAPLPYGTDIGPTDYPEPAAPEPCGTCGGRGHHVNFGDAVPCPRCAGGRA